MDANRLLQLWENVHGFLSENQRRAFLTRAEVTTLVALPDRAVLSAVARSQKLNRIAELAVREAWWYEGEACSDDSLAWCARCKPHPYPNTVVITKGGSAFHRSSDCRGLIEGQSWVAARGGEPGPVELVSVQVALGRGRFACLLCFPAVKSF